MYSVRGVSPGSRRSKEFRDRLKRGDPEVLDLGSARVAELCREGVFGDFFGLDVTLIPAPGSAPLVEGALWVPLRICEALMARGLGGAVARTLSRAYPVKKSAFQAGPDRPSLQEHFDSIEADWLPAPAERIVVVDDVVTSGCTMLAAASRAAEAYPGIPIAGFAMARAVSAGEIEMIRQPCSGLIRPSRNGRAYRRP